MIIFENENKQYIKILFKSKIRKLLKLLIYVLCIFISKISPLARLFFCMY